MDISALTDQWRGLEDSGFSRSNHRVRVEQGLAPSSDPFHLEWSSAR